MAHGEVLIPDWRAAYQQLLTARLVGDKTVLLSVAGIRTDIRTRGMPDYSRFFFRDFATAMELLPDDIAVPALEGALSFLANHQGTKKDPFTGEEPGKFPHELPGVTLGKKRPRNTLFAASDTTALYIHMAMRYLERGGQKEVVALVIPNITAALEYIRTHTDSDGFFWEDPTFCGGDIFALKATHWRDGGIAGRPARTHAYPVCYFATQCLTVAAFRAAAYLAQQGLLEENADSLLVEAEKARAALLRYFWLKPNCNGMPPVAIDARGPLRLIQTDPIVWLWFLEDRDIPYGFRKSCEKILHQLTTPWGFKTDAVNPALPGYQGMRESFWPWEQAYIASVIKKFKLQIDVQPAYQLARTLIDCGAPFTEFVPMRWGKPNRKPTDCCDIQLWTVAYWAWYERNAPQTI